MARKLERADKTSRLLDVKYFMLLPSLADVGTPYDDIHWSAVLKSVSGFEMYRKKYGRITPADVVEFLVMDAEFPRAVRFCIKSASDSLHAITRTPTGAFRYRSEQLMGRLRAELDFASVESVIRGGLHEYLDGLQLKMNEIDKCLASDFAVPGGDDVPSQSQSQSQVGDSIGVIWRSPSLSTTARSTSTDRLVTLSPQVVRLRPAPHVRTTVRSYSLRIEPSQHFVNWQQDAQGNFLCRLTFPEPTRAFVIEMDLVAELSVVNPFDFFLEPEAEQYPFDYPPGLRQELAPYREVGPAGPLLQGLLRSIDRTPVRTIDFLVAMNRLVQDQVGYVIRMEPGVQTSDETLATRSGSCRDSSWLLVELLRHLGFAARFVSGYLIQLKPDVKPLDGPPGPDEDFTDLHAWAEVYLPGAGWIGLDPTSGLLAGEGHIPLAASPHPDSAAPVSGLVSPSQVELHHEMSVRRIHEDPRVTKPYSDEQWQAIEALGDRVDADLQAHDVRLTMGGEPTFVSIDDMDGEEWNTAATGPDKQRLAGALLRRLQHAFARGGLLHFGQGKWYPGESLPRWAYTCYWRTDGVALWRDPSLVGDVDRDYGFTEADAQAFAEGLADRLEVGPEFVMTAYEDPLTYIHQERELPINVNPIDNDLDDPEERDRLRRVFSRGLGTPTGFVLPLARVPGKDGPTWQSGLWMLRSRHLFLLPGDSPVGLRLPLASLQAGPDLQVFPLDPLGAWPPIVVPATARRAESSKRFTVARPGERAQRQVADTAEKSVPRQQVHLQTLESDDAMSPRGPDRAGRGGSPGQAVGVPAAGRLWPGLRGAGGGHRRHGARDGQARAGRRLSAAARSAAPADQGHTRSRRDRGERAPGAVVARARGHDHHVVRAGTPLPPRHREVHARRAAHGHRRRQSRRDWRRDRGRQSLPAAP